MTLVVLALTPDTVRVVSDSACINRATDELSHYPKLQLNTLARTVCVGIGCSAVLDPAYAIVASATSMDDVLARITKALRRSVADHARVFDDNPRDFSLQLFCVAGWSALSGRMLAWTFGAYSYFTPQLASDLVLPPVPLPDYWRPRTIADLVHVARRQAELLVRDNHPRSGEGALLCAELTERGASVTQIANYHDEEIEACSSMAI